MKAINPATLEEIGEVTETPVDQIPRMMELARKSGWGQTTFQQRAEWARRLKTNILERRDEIARKITRSTGKPIFESYSGDLFPAAAILETFARAGHAALMPEPIRIGLFNTLGRESVIERRPIGVAAILSPWNYPFSIPVGDAAMALLAGCSVVLKPSEHVPLVGRLVEELFDASGLPEGAFQVVHGDGRQGAALVGARPDKVVFTGSVTTGKKVAEACGRQLIPCVLEMGGKNPALVLDDAVLGIAADGIVWGAFMNSGQACASVGRALVDKKIYDKFVETAVAFAKQLRTGDPMDPTVDLGSLTTAGQQEKVERLVRDATSKGAQVLTGGGRTGKGWGFQPTVLVEVTPDMAVMREEVFGPVLPIMAVEGEDEAVRIANDSELGLSASVWTADPVRGRRVASRLEAGTVTVNDTSYTFAIPEAPWGGIKQSGYGRVHSLMGLRDFTNPIHINTNARPGRRSLWWFPYSEGQIEMSNALLDACHGEGLWMRVGGWSRALRHFQFRMLKPRG